MIVKPAPGLKVRHPVTKQLLDSEGVTVPDDDIFWTRALNDGDVVRADEANVNASKKSGGDAK